MFSKRITTIWRIWAPRCCSFCLKRHCLLNLAQIYANLAHALKVLVDFSFSLLAPLNVHSIHSQLEIYGIGILFTQRINPLCTPLSRFDSSELNTEGCITRANYSSLLNEASRGKESREAFIYVRSTSAWY